MANLQHTRYQAEIDYSQNPRAIKCQCSNCTWSGFASKLREIGDCSLTPGDASPAGRCPECDSLAYVERGTELKDLFMESLCAWEDEEDSVKQEHASLIARLRAFGAKQGWC